MDNSRDEIRSSGRHGAEEEDVCSQHRQKRLTESLAKNKPHQKAKAVKTADKKRIWKQIK